MERDNDVRAGFTPCPGVFFGLSPGSRGEPTISDAIFSGRPILEFMGRSDFTGVTTAPVGAAAPSASRTKAWFMFEYKL